MVGGDIEAVFVVIVGAVSRAPFFSAEVSEIGKASLGPSGGRLPIAGDSDKEFLRLLLDLGDCDGEAWLGVPDPWLAGECW